MLQASCPVLLRYALTFLAWGYINEVCREQTKNFSLLPAAVVLASPTLQGVGAYIGMLRVTSSLSPKYHVSNFQALVSNFISQPGYFPFDDGLIEQRSNHSW